MVEQLRRYFLLFLFGISAATSICAQKTDPILADSPPIKDGIQWNLVVYQVPPEYPYQARRSGIIGHGILFGKVDPRTGNVVSVSMEKSTGNTILDQAAMNAFRQWRFKPGTVRQFRVPINYEMSSSREEAMKKIRQLKAADAERKK